MRVVAALVKKLIDLSKHTKTKKLLLKVLHYFELGIYIRMVIESFQFITISSASEIRRFSTSSELKIVSLCAA